MVEEYAPPWLGGRPNPIGALVNSLRYRNEWEKLQKLLYRKRGAKSYMQICYAFFQHVLNTVRPFQTSDPRDMIYSILGLIRSFDVGLQIDFPRPDYHLSVVEIWTAATARKVERVPSTLILSWVEETDSQRLPGLPSWVPDFNV